MTIGNSNTTLVCIRFLVCKKEELGVRWCESPKSPNQYWFSGPYEENICVIAKDRGSEVKASSLSIDAPKKYINFNRLGVCVNVSSCANNQLLHVHISFTIGTHVWFHMRKDIYHELYHELCVCYLDCL